MCVEQELLEKWDLLFQRGLFVGAHEGRMAAVLPSALCSEASLKSPVQPMATSQEGISLESLI